MKILLAEEDPAIRMDVSECLATAGHEVLQAQNSQAAYRILREADAIALVIADLDMVSVGGVAVSVKARQCIPDVPVLFIAGHLESPVAQQISRPFSFLRKPFTPNALFAAIRCMVTEEEPLLSLRTVNGVDPRLKMFEHSSSIHDEILVKPTILIVEDDWWVAHSLAAMLRAGPYIVPQPVGSVLDALRAIDAGPISFALVNVELQDGKSYPFVDELLKRGIPFTFMTGYTASDLPLVYSHFDILTKPVSRQKILNFLEIKFRRTVF